MTYTDRNFMKSMKYCGATALLTAKVKQNELHDFLNNEKDLSLGTT